MVSVLQWRIHWQCCTECIGGSKSTCYMSDKDIDEKIAVSYT